MKNADFTVSYGLFVSSLSYLKHFCCCFFFAFFISKTAFAQDMMSHVDLTSDAMTKAELSREEVISRLKQATSQNRAADLSNLSLNGLDLSGLDFSNTNFRASNMNQTNFSKSILKGARLDQAWLLKANFSNSDLSK